MKLRFCLMLFFFCLQLCSCSTQQNNSRSRLSNSDDLLSPEMTKKLITGKAPAPKPEQVKTELKSEINKWWFGHGVGRTAGNLATIVVFPPWGLYLLANAGATIAGYEPIYITDALPEETRYDVLETYDDITSVPGRLNAAISGRRFHNSPSVKKESIAVTKKDLTINENKESRNSSKIDTLASQRSRQGN